jgi:hypothetical protein
MAFNAANLALIGHGNGFCHYRYDTLAVLTDVDGDGYMNNNDDSLNLNVGDKIEVVVWSTAIRTGLISDAGIMYVAAVNASTGAVNLTGDVTSWAPASGD